MVIKPLRSLINAIPTLYQVYGNSEVPPGYSRCTSMVPTLSPAPPVTSPSISLTNGTTRPFTFTPSSRAIASAPPTVSTACCNN